MAMRTLASRVNTWATCTLMSHAYSTPVILARSPGVGSSFALTGDVRNERERLAGDLRRIQYVLGAIIQLRQELTLYLRPHPLAHGVRVRVRQEVQHVEGIHVRHPANEFAHRFVERKVSQSTCLCHQQVIANEKCESIAALSIPAEPFYNAQHRLGARLGMAAVRPLLAN